MPTEKPTQQVDTSDQSNTDLSQVEPEVADNSEKYTDEFGRQVEVTHHGPELNILITAENIDPVSGWRITTKQSQNLFTMFVNRRREAVKRVEEKKPDQEKKSNIGVMVTVFDMNGMKELNDSLGHTEANESIFSYSEYISDSLKIIIKRYPSVVMKKERDKAGGTLFTPVFCGEVNELKALASDVRNLAMTLYHFEKNEKTFILDSKISNILVDLSELNVDQLTESVIQDAQQLAFQELGFQSNVNLLDKVSDVLGKIDISNADSEIEKIGIAEKLGAGRLGPLGMYDLFMGFSKKIWQNLHLKQQAQTSTKRRQIPPLVRKILAHRKMVEEQPIHYYLPQIFYTKLTADKLNTHKLYNNQNIYSNNKRPNESAPDLNARGSVRDQTITIPSTRNNIDQISLWQYEVPGLRPVLFREIKKKFSDYAKSNEDSKPSGLTLFVWKSDMKNVRKIDKEEGSDVGDEAIKNYAKNAKQRIKDIITKYSATVDNPDIRLVFNDRPTEGGDELQGVLLIKTDIKDKIINELKAAFALPVDFQASNGKQLLLSSEFEISGQTVGLDNIDSIPNIVRSLEASAEQKLDERKADVIIHEILETDTLNHFQNDEEDETEKWLGYRIELLVEKWGYRRPTVLGLRYLLMKVEAYTKEAYKRDKNGENRAQRSYNRIRKGIKRIWVPQLLY